MVIVKKYLDRSKRRVSPAGGENHSQFKVGPKGCRAAVLEKPHGPAGQCVNALLCADFTFHQQTTVFMFNKFISS